MLVPLDSTHLHACIILISRCQNLERRNTTSYKHTEPSLHDMVPGEHILAAIVLLLELG